jgi:hypothetical protein
MFPGGSATGLFRSKRRTRAINFRLSEEEFRELQRACAAKGARSVSDFARTAVWRMVAGHPDAQPPLVGGEAIDGRLEQLQKLLDELAGLIREVGPRAVLGQPLGEVEGGRAQKGA